MPPGFGWLLPGFGILILAVVTFRQLKDCGLLGYDAYPLIVSSRIHSVGDFFETFSERLMDGRYRDAFYRPLLNLTIAADYAVWGLRPIGYGATTLFIFACSAMAVFALLKRLAGPGARVAPYVAVAWFIVHPGHRDLLPYLARRAEILCCLFMAWSLWVELSPRQMRRRRIRFLPALLTLAAIASKETGFVQPLVAGFAVFLYTVGGTLRLRIFESIKAIVPHLVAVVLALAARFAVLGQLGGHGELSFDEVGANVRRFALSLVHRLALPPPTGLVIRDLDRVGLWVAAAVFLALGVLWFRRGSKPPSAEPPTYFGRAAAVALAWIVFPLGLYAAMDMLRAWYGLLPTAGFAMLVGLMMEDGLRTVRRGGWISRPVGALLMLFSIVTLVWNVAYSPLIRTMEDWQAATAANEVFLSEVTERAAAAPYGTTVNTAPARIQQPGAEANFTGGAAALATYSVQAWVELTVPDRRVRVRKADPGRLEYPASNEVLVLLYPHMKE